MVGTVRPSNEFGKGFSISVDLGSTCWSRPPSSGDSPSRRHHHLPSCLQRPAADRMENREPESSQLPLLRLEGNLDLRVAARRRGSHSGSDALGMLPNERPPGGTCQDDEGDAASLQVLLVPDAPVGRKQQFEPCLLGGVQERAVAECAPTLRLRRGDGVPRQRTGKPLRRPVVKEDEHR